MDVTEWVAQGTDNEAPPREAIKIHHLLVVCCCCFFTSAINFINAKNRVATWSVVIESKHTKGEQEIDQSLLSAELYALYGGEASSSLSLLLVISTLFHRRPARREKDNELAREKTRWLALNRNEFNYKEARNRVWNPKSRSTSRKRRIGKVIAAKRAANWFYSESRVVGKKEEQEQNKSGRDNNDNVRQSSSECVLWKCFRFSISCGGIFINPVITSSSHSYFLLPHKVKERKKEWISL